MGNKGLYRLSAQLSLVGNRLDLFGEEVPFTPDAVTDEVVIGTIVDHR